MALTQVSTNGVKDGSLLNADINASAAIASSKLAKPIDLGDNEKIRLGSSNDLEIFHNGTSNIIEAANGDLNIRMNNSENAIVARQNGAAELYHDNSKKLETTSTGINISGSVPTITLSDTDGSTPYSTITAGGGDLVFEADQGNEEANTLMLFRVDDSERLRIGSSGHLYATSSDSGITHLTLRKGSSDADVTDFLQCRNNANALHLVIEGDGDVKNQHNSYGAVSDIKLKENIVDANSQWNDIKAIKVRNFNFKESTGFSTHTQIGVVAQELETSSPNLVYESIDRDPVTGEDLETKTKNVRYSVMYMKAIKCLQEAIAKIEVLETKVAALETG